MSIRSIFLPLIIVSLAATGWLSGSPGAHAQVVEPQIVFSGNGQPIANGDDTPRTEDGTDFGSTTEGAPIVRLFATSNQGTVDLHVDGVTVPDGFSVSVIGGALPATVAPNASLFLLIQCLAEKAETYTGFISVTSDDPDDGRAGFAIACRVNAQPEIDVAGSTIPIANGDTTPSVTDATDFGVTPEDAQVIHTFTVANRGAGDLTIGGVSVPDGFSLLTTPPAVLPDGGSAALEVRCDARDPGDYSGFIEIESNDADEGSFRFAIRCLVQGDDDPLFNPGPDDLPPAESPVTPVPSVTTPPPGSGVSDDAPPSDGQGGGDLGTQVPTAAPAPISTPTRVPTARPTTVANTGNPQSNLRPPNTGDGGLAAQRDSAFPAWLIVAAGIGVGLAVVRRRSPGQRS